MMRTVPVWFKRRKVKAFYEPIANANRRYIYVISLGKNYSILCLVVMSPLMLITTLETVRTVCCNQQVWVDLGQTLL